MPPVLGVLLPHPPVMIPEIGQDEAELAQQTIDKAREAAQTVKSLAPDTIVVITPHGLIFEDGVTVMGGYVLSGTFGEFGNDTPYQLRNDTELVAEIKRLSDGAHAKLYLLDEEIKKQTNIHTELDYGALVPLYFMLEAGYTGPIVHVTVGLVSPLELYQAGMIIQQAADQLGRKIVVIASGDNSHALSSESPEGSRPEGKQFDDMLTDGIRQAKWQDLMLVDRDFTEAAAEDTILSLTIMLGCFEGSRIQPSLLSYEAPFGIGYTVATFRGLGLVGSAGHSSHMPDTAHAHADTASQPQPSGQPESLYLSLQQAISRHIQQRRSQESPPAKLARVALEYYVKNETRPDINKLKQLITLDNDTPHGVFVTIKHHGNLRGCIGSTEPVSECLYEDIITYAIEAGTEDDRFFPVEEDELDELLYSVSLLSPPEPITSLDELDPKRYGLIVETDEHYGLLLPDLAGIDDAETQLREVLEKAGLAELSPDARLYRFTAHEYE